MRSYLYVLIIIVLFISSFTAQNINLSKGFVFDGEPYIAVNPYNSQHLIVVWMGYKFNKKIVIKIKNSYDGGNNWNSTKSLPHSKTYFTSADPSIAFGPNGEIYVAFVDFTGFDTDNIDGGIYIAKSEDGGHSWNIPAEVLNINTDPSRMAIDRPWISVDRSDRNTKGNIYITSMNAKKGTAPYHPYVSISKDRGKTFDWKYIDDENWLSGNSIPQPMPTNTTTNSGVFYAIYPSYALFQNPLPRFIVAKSEDGGNSFSYNTVFSTTTTINDLYAKKGYLVSSDPTDPKHLIFLRLSNNNGNLDVGFSETYDGGTNWTNIDKINDDNSLAMQDMIWGAFNEKGDYLATWRDRRKGFNETYINPYEFWAAVKYKDSISFSENFRISDTIIQFDDLLLKSGNDFMSTAYIMDTLYSVWGDTRNGKLNIWFQKMTIPGKTISNTQIISNEIVMDFNVFPNPTANELNIVGKDIYKITIFDIKGNIINDVKMQLPVDK